MSPQGTPTAPESAVEPKPGAHAEQPTDTQPETPTQPEPRAEPEPITWPCTAPDPWPTLLRESGGAWVRLLLPEGHYDGFLLGAGRDWVLLGVLDAALRPDGHLAIRRDLLESVRDPAPRAHVVRGALATWGHPAPAPTRLPLDALAQLLPAIARQWPTVTLHRDGPQAPGETAGQYLGHQGLNAWILPLDAEDAEYGERPLPVPLGAVTRVRFGDAATHTLARIAAGILVPEPEDEAPFP